MKELRSSASGACRLIAMMVRHSHIRQMLDGASPEFCRVVLGAYDNLGHEQVFKAPSIKRAISPF